MTIDNRNGVTNRQESVHAAAVNACDHRRRAPMRFGMAVAALCIAVSSSAALLELDETLQRANAASQRGDWQSVASQLAQAINHPDLPATGLQRSAIHREYGRSVAVFCQYDEAEKYLLLARDIARAAGDSGFDAELERGIVLATRGNLVQAVDVFETLLRVSTAAGSKAPPPHRLAMLQEHLAHVLSRLNRPDEAESHRARALALRQANPATNSAAKESEVPYGTQCRKR